MTNAWNLKWQLNITCKICDELCQPWVNVMKQHKFELQDKPDKIHETCASCACQNLWTRVIHFLKMPSTNVEIRYQKAKLPSNYYIGHLVKTKTKTESNFTRPVPRPCDTHDDSLENSKDMSFLRLRSKSWHPYEANSIKTNVIMTRVPHHF